MKTGLTNFDLSFSATADRLKKLLDREKDDAFKIAAIQALQTLELIEHHNNEQALLALVACAQCYYAGDLTAARVLLFVSGALVSDALCAALCQTILQMTQVKVKC